MQDQTTTSPYMPALFGYALGTLQVLLLDWFKKRAVHRKDVRLLLAELRRVKNLNKRFNWGSQIPIGEVPFPKPPSVSPAFVGTVTGTDFSLTDEHEDDNTLQELLAILDACDVSTYHQKLAADLIDHINDPATPDNLRIQDVRSALRAAARYDSDIATLQECIADLIRDMERRLRIVRFWRQLGRAVPLRRKNKAVITAGPTGPKGS